MHFCFAVSEYVIRSSERSLQTVFEKLQCGVKKILKDLFWEQAKIHCIMKFLQKMILEITPTIIIIIFSLFTILNELTTWIKHSMKVYICTYEIKKTVGMTSHWGNNTNID